jgi:hypothetical protein
MQAKIERADTGYVVVLGMAGKEFRYDVTEDVKALLGQQSPDKGDGSFDKVLTTALEENKKLSEENGRLHLQLEQGRELLNRLARNAWDTLREFRTAVNQIKAVSEGVNTKKEAEQDDIPIPVEAEA